MPHIICGHAYFSLCNFRGQNPDMSTLFSSGFSNYGRNMGGILWRDLFTFLWSLLLIVPGIVKACSYFMVPYLLTEHPDVGATEALDLSKIMTDGHKGQIFVLLLQDFGWKVLSVLTLGLVWLLYSGPYMETTKAGLYEQIKNENLANGSITPGDLDHRFRNY